MNLREAAAAMREGKVIRRSGWAPEFHVPYPGVDAKVFSVDEVLADDWCVVEPGPEPHGFGWALDRLRAGERVARAGWNGCGMFLYLADYGMFKRNGVPGQASEGPSEPFIVMSAAQRTEIPWLCFQADALATDWEVVE